MDLCSTRDGQVDIIWAMANQRAQTDEQWFERAPAASFGGSVKVIRWRNFFVPKLYIHAKRDHVDGRMCSISSSVGGN